MKFLSLVLLCACSTPKTVENESPKIVKIATDLEPTTVRSPGANTHTVVVTFDSLAPRGTLTAWAYNASTPDGKQWIMQDNDCRMTDDSELVCHVDGSSGDAIRFNGTFREFTTGEYFDIWQLRWKRPITWVRSASIDGAIVPVRSVNNELQAPVGLIIIP